MDPLHKRSTIPLITKDLPSIWFRVRTLGGRLVAGLRLVGGLGTLDHGTYVSDCKLPAIVLFNTKFVPELADSCYTKVSQVKLQAVAKKKGW